MKPTSNFNNSKLFILFFVIVALSGMQQTLAQSYTRLTNSDPDAGTAIDKSGPVTYDNQGNAYFTGTYLEPDSFGTWNITGAIIWKVSPSGTTLNTAKYNYSSMDEGANVVYDIKVIGSAVYVLIQCINRTGSRNDADVVLVKYNLSLSFQWNSAYNGIGNPNDLPVEITAGPSGSILLLAQSLDNIVTQKYNTLGVALYTRIYNSPGGLVDVPKKIVYFKSATYVAGNIETANGHSSLLIKYNNNLVEQWSNYVRYSSASFNDVLQDLKVDTSGNPYISGIYRVSATAFRPYLVKYNPASAARTWTKKVGVNSLDGAFLFMNNVAEPILYCRGSGVSSRYMRFDRNTGAALLTVNLFPPGTGVSFIVKSVLKGTDNSLYAFGSYDSSAGFPYDEFFGVQIAKINTSGNVVWRSQERLQWDPHFYNFLPGGFAVRANARVFWTQNESCVCVNGDNYVAYGAISAVTGMRVEAHEVINENEIVLYPNPAKDKVALRYNSDADEELILNVYDLNGKLKISLDLNCNEGLNDYSLNTLEWKSGLYLLQLNSPGKIISKKLVIE